MIEIKATDYTKEELIFLREAFAKGTKSIRSYCAKGCNNCEYQKPCNDYIQAYLYVDTFARNKR